MGQAFMASSGRIPLSSLSAFQCPAFSLSIYFVLPAVWSEDWARRGQQGRCRLALRAGPSRPTVIFQRGRGRRTAAFGGCRLCYRERIQLLYPKSMLEQLRPFAASAESWFACSFRELEFVALPGPADVARHQYYQLALSHDRLDESAAAAA